MRAIDTKIPASYNAAVNALRGKDLRNLSANTRLVTSDRGDSVEVQYHGTPVVTFRPGIVTLLTGGWRTPTTKARINAALREIGATVYQHKGEWRVRLRGHSDRAFVEGFTIAQ